ncbi:mannose-6-phosphate isomerase, class I [Planococcus sp. 107-1]|uniref:mannose-6-phosphate isomerase, class I n=1 Tax=Planococcus sp. 107-1 TaxID=2908840 RepID=UPI001F492D39|nr:mannose-6-phosphate isomerase, class I [Planococcus sp. 107-1]UJF26652.1 mannose-6-phosphate isomerase, class I [Planococcus sp. 107-1]
MKDSEWMVEEVLMHPEPIFLEPVFHERIWGGRKLQTLFGYPIPSGETGEAWVIAAHKNGSSKIAAGPLKGRSLLEVWNDYPGLFGKASSAGDFPLLVKILDAHDDLSVQVHPDDEYAKRAEKEPFGKNECWYVLDCEKNSYVVFGHRAESKEDFKRRVEEEEWDDLLIRVEVEKGDFFYVPSGTVHAVGKGNVILEIQQSSDITYRVYDYGRKDADGNTRELHLQSAVDVIKFPHCSPAPRAVEEKSGNLVIRQLIQETYFTVYHWQVDGKAPIPMAADYLLLNVISGAGMISGSECSFPIAKGDHLILPASIEAYSIEGELEIIVSHE